MAKVISGAHSQYVVGKFGYIIFSRYRGINRACIKYKQKNPKSDLQLKIRTAYSMAWKYWRTSISQEWKEDYEALSHKYKEAGLGIMSGFNVFMSAALLRYKVACFPFHYPSHILVTKPGDLFIIKWFCLF